jgi:DNA-binding NtrC family response regulator
MTEPSTNALALPPLDARILLADDEPVVLRVLSTYLSRRGAHVVLAHNGADALEKLVSEQIELVITDVNMPGGSGLGLLNEVKARWPDLPVILMTGALDPETVVAALHSGADRYLLKPFSVDELGKRVEEALSRRVARLRERAERVDMEQRLIEQEVEVRSLVLRGVRSLVEAVEAKDP